MGIHKADGSTGEEGVCSVEKGCRPGSFSGDSETAREFAEGLPAGETAGWKLFEKSGKIEDYLRYRGYR